MKYISRDDKDKNIQRSKSSRNNNRSKNNNAITNNNEFNATFDKWLKYKNKKEGKIEERRIGKEKPGRRRKKN